MLKFTRIVATILAVSIVANSTSVAAFLPSTVASLALTRIQQTHLQEEALIPLLGWFTHPFTRSSSKIRRPPYFQRLRRHLNPSVSRWKRIDQAIESLWTLWGKAAKIAVMGASIFLFGVSLRTIWQGRNDVLIDYTNVPSSFDASGNKSDVFRRKVIARIDEMLRAAQTPRPIDRLEDQNTEKTVLGLGTVMQNAARELPDFKIPETDVSFQSVARWLQRRLGWEPEHIAVDLTNSNGMRLTVYTGKSSNDLKVQGTYPLISEDPDALAGRVAEQILRKENPFLLAVYKYHFGHTPEEEREAEDLLRNVPEDKKGWANLLRAIILTHEEKYSAAIQLYREIAETKSPSLRRDHLKANAYNGWGNAIADLALKSDFPPANYAAAERQYRKALQIDPEMAEAENNLGDLRSAQFIVDEKTAAHYQKAIQLNPVFVDAYLNLGDVRDEQKKYNEAKRLYEKAQSLNPNYPLTYNRLGNLAKEQNNIPQAKMYYEKELALDPHDITPYWNMANLYLQQNDLEEAANYYEKMIAVDPKFIISYISLGDIRFDQGSYAKAALLYQAYIDHKGDKLFEANSNLGDALYKLHEYDQAVDAYEEATHHPPPDTDELKEINKELAGVRTRQGSVRFDQHQYDEAARFFTLAMNLDWRNFTAVYDLGLIRFKERQYTEAAALFKMASQLAPTHADTHYNLGLALQKMGQQAEAKEEFRKSEKLNQVQKSRQNNPGHNAILPFVGASAVSPLASLVHAHPMWFLALSLCALLLLAELLFKQLFPERFSALADRWAALRTNHFKPNPPHPSEAIPSSTACLAAA